MNRKLYLRPLSFALALLLALALVPPSALADDENPFAVAAVQDILIKPGAKDGHVRFGVAADVKELQLRGEDGKAISATATSIDDALETVCKNAFPESDSVKDVGLDYISYVSVSAIQGTIYDGYNTEGDTGAGVAGVKKYYHKDAASNYRIANIRFVPKTSFSGQAMIEYYGYYHYTTKDDSNNLVTKEVVKTGSYTGRIYITVSKQEPGIAYSTDGEPAQFAADDFATYSSAVTGRTFKYVSFRLPSEREGTLYYNYISDSVYDYPVAAAQRFYRKDTPTVDRVFFVPAKDYAGEVHIEFTGVDSAETPILGELVIHVTNYGPEHSQPRAEGPFVYRVAAGQPVSLDQKAFEDQVQLQIGEGETFSHFNLASLPPAET